MIRYDFLGILHNTLRAHKNGQYFKKLIHVCSDVLQPGISYTPAESIEMFRQKRSLARELKLFKVNRPFVAMLMTRGRLLCNIFSMHITGR